VNFIFSLQLVGNEGIKGDLINLVLV